MINTLCYCRRRALIAYILDKAPQKVPQLLASDILGMNNNVF